MWINSIYRCAKVLDLLLHRHTRDNILIPFLLKVIGFRVLDRKELLISNNRNILFWGGKEKIETKSSSVSGEAPKSIENRFFKKFILESPFVAELSNVQLIGKEAIGISGIQIISETTLPPHTYLEPRYEGGITIRSLVTGRFSMTETPTFSLACSLVNSWNKNYYHWIIDCLSRLEGLEFYRDKKNQNPKLIINASPTEWQKESLRVLGYELDKCIEWKYSKVNIEKLIIPSFRRQGEWLSPSSLAWLKRKILAGLSIESGSQELPARIYISRANASGRQVTNEDEVLDFLDAFGFKVFELENLSFSEQVRLFSNAELIVSPHGAGLTNIIFSQPGTSILEFVTPSSSPGYFVLSMILGFKHACLACQQTPFQKIRQTRGNIYVDISDLRCLLAKIL